MGSMTIPNVIAGSRVTGIYPFDREAVIGPISNINALSEETRLSFIPMISSAVRRFTSRRDFTPDLETREQDLMIVNLRCLSFCTTKGMTSQIMTGTLPGWPRVTLPLQQPPMFGCGLSNQLESVNCLPIHHLPFEPPLSTPCPVAGF